MPKFGRTSRERLETCHKDLQLIMNIAIKIMDFSVIFGHRSIEEQQKLFSQGRNSSGKIVDRSKVVTYVDGVEKKSDHNFLPSRAVDIAPYPIDWSNDRKAIARFYLLAGVILAIAWILRIEIEWGGDWDRDWELRDQSFDDIGHFAVRNP